MGSKFERFGSNLKGKPLQSSSITYRVAARNTE